MYTLLSISMLIISACSLLVGVKYSQRISPIIRILSIYGQVIPHRLLMIIYSLCFQRRLGIIFCTLENDLYCLKYGTESTEDEYITRIFEFKKRDNETIDHTDLVTDFNSLLKSTAGRVLFPKLHKERKNILIRETSQETKYPDYHYFFLRIQFKKNKLNPIFKKIKYTNNKSEIFDYSAN